MTFAQYLDIQPVTKKIFAQFEKNCLPEKIDTQRSHAFLFWRPAVDVYSFTYRINPDCILTRTTIVAQIIGSLGLIYGSLSCLVASLPLALLYYRWEKSRAKTHTHQIASKNFQSSLPSATVLKYIIESNDLKLLEQMDDLTKLDDRGRSLYDYCCASTNPRGKRLPLFKKVADAIFAQELTKEQKYEYFCAAMCNNQVDFVKYLLSSEKIKSQDLLNSQHFDCFVFQSKNFQITSLLVHYGFNLEATNRLGFTPLLCLLSAIDEMKVDDKSYESCKSRIESLLKLKAKVDAKVHVEGVEKGVLDFSSFRSAVNKTFKKLFNRSSIKSNCV